MRKIVSWEGEEKLRGIWIAVGALKWTDEPLAVCWNYEWGDLAVASASDFRREEDGSITANIILNPDRTDVGHIMELVKNDDVSFAIYATGITREKNEDDESENPVYHVTEGTIRGVGMVMKNQAAW